MAKKISLNYTAGFERAVSKLTSLTVFLLMVPDTSSIYTLSIGVITSFTVLSLISRALCTRKFIKTHGQELWTFKSSLYVSPWQWELRRKREALRYSFREFHASSPTHEALKKKPNNYWESHRADKRETNSPDLLKYMPCSLPRILSRRRAMGKAIGQSRINREKTRGEQ